MTIEDSDMWINWSRLVEPGNETAQVVIGALGCSAGLQWVLGEHEIPLELLQAAYSAVPQQDKSIVRAKLLRSRETWRERVGWLDPDRDRRTLARLGGRFLHPGHPEWPTSLGELAFRQPVGLWVLGDRELPEITERAVAMVGARAASQYGEHVAQELSFSAAQRGVTVVSGGAYGIDGAAHRAVLRACGSTVAILAGGIDRLYPRGHESLLREIARSGLLIAECAPGVAPSKWRFLQRNRLIAALSQATVVVEAGARSGALNTAGWALELSRPVGAVPGPITSGGSQGCHKVLREMAGVCITGANDMLELVLPFSETLDGQSVQHELPFATPSETRLLDTLNDRKPLSSQEISAVSGLTFDEVQVSATRLELAGKVYKYRKGWLLRRS